MPQKSAIKFIKELEINKILITINDFFKIMEVVVVSKAFKILFKWP